VEEYRASAVSVSGCGTRGRAPMDQKAADGDPKGLQHAQAAAVQERDRGGLSVRSGVVSGSAHDGAVSESQWEVTRDGQRKVARAVGVITLRRGSAEDVGVMASWRCAGRKYTK
jgi:hypothetical protein